MGNSNRRLLCLFSLFVLSEVQIKVQVFDNSDLSPLADAQVNVHGNKTLLASGRAGSDGVVRVSFLYRTGSWVIITAAKRDYVTNSVPWHSSRIPCESVLLISGRC
uniref:FAM171 N-terminal domain-containing protein n=1 Tax=Oryzias sinensis TaxID=183150 RepID=A0A8C7YEK2_9TELE